MTEKVKAEIVNDDLDYGSTSQFESEEDKVTNGIWIGKDDFRPNRDGSVPEFLILPADRDLNQKFARALVYWRRRNPRMMNSHLVDGQEATEKMIRYAFLHTCILNWRNFKDRKGKDIPYNRENLMSYMDRYPALYNRLLAAAVNEALFMKSEIEDVVGE